MVVYVLHYFNMPGRAELIRLLFTAADQPFTDTRVEPADWPALQASNITPWSSLPYLEVDGKVLGQSKAIYRFLGQTLGLGGVDLFQQSLVDSVVEATSDVRMFLAQFKYAEPHNKEKALRQLKDVTIPTVFRSLDRFIGEHGQDGFAVGKQLTTADLAIFDAINQVQANPSVGLSDVAAEYPSVRRLFSTVLRNPTVAAYVKKTTP